MRAAVYMLSCPQRSAVRERTLADLAATDWDEPATVVLDDASDGSPRERQQRAARRLLARALDERPDADLVLFLEDDLVFNRSLRHNLERWAPVCGHAPGEPLFASLYNPGIRGRVVDAARTCVEVDPGAVYGSQALVLSRTTAEHVVAGWHEVDGLQDIKMSRLAARLGPVLYHAPSLVQHVFEPSTWGGTQHAARDFDASWRAPAGDRAPSAARAVALARLRRVDGWLAEDEAAALFDAAVRAAPGAVVEVGSMWGRSTVVLATAVEAHGGRVHAIDPHDGVVSVLGGGTACYGSTWDAFEAALADAGVREAVTPIRARSHEVPWQDPIALLFLDGLHDGPSVARDLAHFLPCLGPGAEVAFHDYGTHFRGVKECVDGLLAQPGWAVADAAGSLVVVRRR